MEQPSRNRERLRRLCEEIKNRIDYRSFYQHYCPEARSSGARLHAQCPIPAHSHTGQGNPSLSVDLARGLFHCFSRDEGGDAIRFYELMHNATFARAVGEMAHQLGLDDTQRSLAFRAAPDREGLEAQGLEALAPDRMQAVCESFEACGGRSHIEGRSYWHEGGFCGYDFAPGSFISRAAPIIA